MGHKYLSDLKDLKGLPWGVSSEIGDKNDKRKDKWKQQKRKYGFDERETWSLNYTFYCWLYEHLKMYLDMADPVVDLNYYKFTYKGETKTQKEWIVRMIEYCELYLTEPDTTDKEKCKKAKDVVNIWNMLLPCMWW